VVYIDFRQHSRILERIDIYQSVFKYRFWFSVLPIRVASI
jgi:hypothetical protein